MTLCGSGGAFRPRGASGRRLFHYSGPLPAGNRNNGRIRPGMRGERRGNGKFQKSVKIILVNTVQNHDAWHTPPAFCLSAEAFPFIVMHGPCPVPVVQWIEYKIPVLTIWVRIPSGSLPRRLLQGAFFIAYPHYDILI